MMLSTLSAAVLISSGSPAPPQQAEPPDLFVRNAKIWTADPQRPEASWMAVRAGVIVAIGGETDMMPVLDDETAVIDAEGRRLLPGLIDTHVHLAGAASDMRHLDLRPATSRAHLLNMLREYAERFDADAWVVGTRWTAESWPDQHPPTADEIDEAVGGRKAVLIRMDGHSLLASRSALEYAGITKDGPADPPGGAIGRFEDGTPTGQIYEQAQGLVQRHVTLPEVDHKKLLLRAVQEANRLGLTQVGAIESRSTIENLASLDRAGDLTLRVNATVSGGGDTVSRWQPVLEWATENRHLSDRVRTIGFKGYMDGTLGSRTAWMMEPYEDNHMAADKSADNVGFPLAMAATGELAELIRLGASMDLQPAVHAIGDRSNHELLNWYESLPDAKRRELRPRIEHAQHLLPEDVARFVELGVVASMQPYHKADDGRYAEQRLGPKRIKSSYAFRSLLDTGAMLAFGSDWPVVSANPFLGIHAAVSAQTLDGKTFVPEQSITVEEALIAYTSTAAKALHSEDTTGMLRPGYAADFTILDRDVLQIPVSEIPEIEVLRTVVGGGTVYERE